MTESKTTVPAIKTTHLTYTFPETKKVGLYDINITLPRSSRLLLVGPNGAGKSTLLKILAGQKLIKQGSIELNGGNPFAFDYAEKQRCGTITYLGTEWANNGITQRDIPVTVLIDSVGGNVYPERRDMLVNLLDLDISWRMNSCSDGERRRVQLCMGLLKPWDLLLLDEVTVDLDVLVRFRLLGFLKKECEERGCSVVYATHIFDGLGDWPSQIAHLSGGCIVEQYAIDDIKYVDGGEGEVVKKDKAIEVQKAHSLYPLALNWLADDLKLRGERTEDKTRPKFEELSKKTTEMYYDDKARITDYFKTTRTTN
ncbi:unnamed protein product [Ambrosiozyma monospora]|uniref:Unnamed protein product n=1 Tax=Ambrosiozyma monospora TaxID=43982 RepID=A0ACB5SSN6_AMBMO|nr:unnamed protein product [Ambrosiozyma monospora]